MVEERRGVLLIGNGGREHAWAWKLGPTPRQLYIDSGTGQMSEAKNVPHLTPDRFLDLLVFARESGVDVVVLGREAPCIAGIEGTFPYSVRAREQSKCS